MLRLAGYTRVAAVAILAVGIWAQQPKTPAEEVAEAFAYINRQVLDMAKDFPADKYDYKLRPEMRSFGAVIVHIASGNVYAAKAGRGEKVKWDELDAANYKTKEQAVALLEKSIADATATLKSRPAESFHKSDRKSSAKRSSGTNSMPRITRLRNRRSRCWKNPSRMRRLR